MLRGDLLWADDRPIVDSPLARARKAIADTSIQVASFDFFDTLVKRDVETPCDLFVDVGERLIAAGLLAPYVTATAFKSQRMLAERSARARSAQAKGHTEVSLPEIYEELHDKIGLTGSLEKAVQIELEVERGSLTGSDAGLGLLNLAKELGRRVVVVSDTYFSEENLRSFVALPEEAEVFCSSAHGAGKGGDLWSRVLEKLDVEPSQMVHIGDNFHADVERPAGYGITAVHLPAGSHELIEVRRRERLFLPFSASENAVAALRVKARLSALREEALLGVESPTSPRGTGASVFGPVFHLYLRWVRDTWERMDRPMVVGLLRGGGYLAHLAADLFPEMDVRQLWTSRLAVAKASLANPSVEAMLQLLPHHNALPVAMFAARLGLELDAIPAAFHDQYVSLSNPQVARAIADQVMADAMLKAKVAAAGKVAAIRFQRHLSTVFSGIGGRHALLLDHGWAGKTAASLVNDWGLPQDRIHAMFLAVNRGGTHNASTGARISGYVFSDAEDHRLADLALRHIEIVEQIGTVDCGSVQDYAEDGSPILGGDFIPTQQREERRAMRLGIRDYCRLAEKRLADTPVNTAAAQSVAQAILIRACLDPLPHERAMYARWVHDDSVAGGAIDALVPPEYVELLDYMTPGHLLNAQLPGSYWLLGADDERGAALSRGAVLQSLVGDGLQVGAYDTPVRAALLPADAAGAHADFLSPLRVNGRGYAIVSVRPEPGVSRLVLSLDTASPVLVRLEKLLATELPVRDGGRRTSLLDADQAAGKTRWDGLGPQTVQIPGYLEVSSSAIAAIDLADVIAENPNAGLFAVALHVIQPVQAEQAKPERGDASAANWQWAYTTMCGVPVKEGEGKPVILPTHLTVGAFSGWCFNKKVGCGPDSAELVLTSASNSYVSPMTLSVRPDLSVGFKKLIVGAAGCQGQANLQALPPGRYAVHFRVRSFGESIDLPVQFAFDLSQTRDGLKVLISRSEPAKPSEPVSNKEPASVA